MAKQPLDIDVTDRTQLEEALRVVAEQEGGRERVVAFAARAALRAVPALAALNFWDGSDHKATFLSPSFRAVAASWVISAYRADDVTDSILDAASAAAAATVSAVHTSLDYSPKSRVVYGACEAIVLAAYVAGGSAEAVPAADAVNAARVASDAAADIAFAADIRSIRYGEEIATRPLWPDEEPKQARANWRSLRKALDKRNDWWVWRDWYEARLRGGDAYPQLSAAANERIEIARVLEIENEDWEQGPAHVNAKIKAIIERETERDQREHSESGQTPSLSGGRFDDPPPEPDPGPGPNYSIQEGQLHLDPSPPIPSDEASSAALLPLLQRATADLQQLCQKLDNTHPRLAEAVRNYTATLDAPFEGLSVPSVWAYGGLLAELRQGFEAQSPSIMTEALEPEVSAQLANVVRQHAAFILGTEQGRDLVERADRFQQAPETIEEIREPVQEILDEFSDNEDLVDAETRAAHAPIRDHLRAIEWGACRTSYAGYLIVRKATFAMLRLVVGKEASLAAIVGAATGFGVLVGDPSLDFLRVAIPVLRDQAAAILAFYKHSPELRSYAEYALNLIEAAEEKLDPRVKPEDDA